MASLLRGLESPKLTMGCGYVHKCEPEDDEISAYANESSRSVRRRTVILQGRSRWMGMEGRTLGIPAFSGCPRTRFERGKHPCVGYSLFTIGGVFNMFPSCDAMRAMRLCWSVPCCFRLLASSPAAGTSLASPVRSANVPLDSPSVSCFSCIVGRGVVTGGRKAVAAVSKKAMVWERTMVPKREKGLPLLASCRALRTRSKKKCLQRMRYTC